MVHSVQGEKGFLQLHKPGNSMLVCGACSRPDAPARCSRCFEAYCGPECQRKAWPKHKLVCTPKKVPDPQRAQARGDLSKGIPEQLDSELAELPSFLQHGLQVTEALDRVGKLAESHDLLEALGTGLSAQLSTTKKDGQAGQGDAAKLSQVVDVLWHQCGWQPHVREKHEYSLLHALPESCAMEEASRIAPEGPGSGALHAPARLVAPPRHEQRLVGRQCPVIDAQGTLSLEVKKQLASFFNPTSPYPCIVRNLPIFPRAVDCWDVEYLCQHMGSQLYHTFASSQSMKRFAYSFESRNEGGYEPSTIAEAQKMTFAEFVRKQQVNEDGKSYYLQTPVLRYEGGIVTSAKFDEQLEADLHTMNRHLVHELAQLGGFGELSRNQLFVSYSDFLTAVHYDQQHNLYLQLRGCKRFLLFDVTCAPAMYPYPVHHSLDRKARVDLESLDLNTWPNAQALVGRGVDALLLPGDILFLPMSWFHHVHSIGEENVSLNWWFYDSGGLFDPAKVCWPLSNISLVEFSRHIEYFIAEQLGPSLVGAFMNWWLGTGSGPGQKLLADRWRMVRNYVLWQMLKLPRCSSKFVLAALDPKRWMRLDSQPHALKASQGLRDEHKVPELLTGLDELALGVFHSRMPAFAYRVLGRAIDCISRHKLRFFLECCEEVLVTLRDFTDWGQPMAAPRARPDGGKGFLFEREEARKAPVAILRTLGELCDLAEARYVRVTTVDNGLFANWLQVLDACYFATVTVEPDWIITGQEREFNYGSVGDDVFHGLFKQLSDRVGACEPREPRFDVTHRFNFLLVNVFRGQFLRGPSAAKRREEYAEVASQCLQPCPEVLKLRDRILEQRGPGVLIGVHKRVDNPGTARMQLEQRMLRTECYIDAALKLVHRYSQHGTPTVFLATDDEPAVSAFRAAFGQHLILNESAKRTEGGINDSRLPREVHGQPTRLTIADARDCLVDALVLASCDAVIHADSNVSIAAGIMNPKSDVYHVRDLVTAQMEGGAWPGYKRCSLPF